MYHSQLELPVTLKPSFIIYSLNVISHEVISGNITATISDHLSQFLSAFNILSKNSCQKSNIYERDWSKSIQTDFVLDCFDKDWSDVCQLDQQDTNLSIESFRQYELNIR